MIKGPARKNKVNGSPVGVAMAENKTIPKIA
jgi:hypothetical protein